MKKKRARSAATTEKSETKKRKSRTPNRKPTEPDTAQHQIGEVGKDTLRTVVQAIAALCAEFPDPVAAFQLAKLMSGTIVPLLCDRLSRASEADRARKDGWTPQTTSYLADSILGAAVLFSKALLTYAHGNPQAKEHISKSSVWPVLIALDPFLNFRKVVRNPNGPAAQLYAPILKWLGTEMLLDRADTRNPGIFHAIAQAASRFVSECLGSGWKLRDYGLPWMFDYPDGLKAYALSWSVCQQRGGDGTDVHVTNEPRLGKKREWGIAVKFYIYLTRAPEPERSAVRKYWRKFREDAFAQFRPATTAEQRLHRRLRSIKALPPPSDADNNIRASVHFNRVNLEKATQLFGQEYFEQQRGAWNPDKWNEKLPGVYEPDWVMWWREYLQYQPDALFGNEPSLTEIKAPAGVKPVENTRKSPKFVRYVEAVLGAFLTMAGGEGGLKAIQSARDPLPRIRGGEPDFEKS